MKCVGKCLLRYTTLLLLASAYGHTMQRTCGTWITPSTPCSHLFCSMSSETDLNVTSLDEMTSDADVTSCSAVRYCPPPPPPSSEGVEGVDVWGLAPAGKGDRPPPPESVFGGRGSPRSRCTSDSSCTAERGRYEWEGKCGPMPAWGESPGDGKGVMATSNSTCHIPLPCVHKPISHSLPLPPSPAPTKPPSSPRTDLGHLLLHVPRALLHGSPLALQTVPLGGRLGEGVLQTRLVLVEGGQSRLEEE